MLVKHGCFQLLVWEADGTVRWEGGIKATKIRIELSNFALKGKR